MANFGELVLILGDLHIPERASSIPEKFKRMLVPNKMQHILCTGNIGREQFNEFCALAPNVHVVRGDFDDDENLVFPEVQVVRLGEFRIGLIHGHQLLPSASSRDAKRRLRHKLNVDILVTGHTGKNEVVEDSGFYHINPGSITGAYSALNPDATPSFVLLALQGPKIVCYVYEMSEDGEVEVTKTEITKSKQAAENAGPLGGSGNNPELLQSLLA
mmetsp:Transcript_27902/g.65598  ORF Transcript_27902/g.65598 Transcript_27902/m.65598 type:complete len:216 (-) Transcript_27902:248-895(-)